MLRQKPRPSPLEASQPLVQVEVAARRVRRRAVGGTKAGGAAVRTVLDGRLSFVAHERGLEWERPFARARLPKEPLPPITEVLSSIMTDFNLDRARGSVLEERSLHKRFPFGGCEPFRGGPRLPVRRALSIEEEDALAKREAQEARERARRAARPRPTEAKAKAKESKPLPGLGPQAAPPEEDSRSQSAAEEPAAGEAAAAAKQQQQLQLQDGDEENTMPFPWDQDELRAVFAKFDWDLDGEVHQEELPGLLRYLGCRIRDEEVMRLAKEQTRFVTLMWEEFVEFMHRFRDFDVGQMRALFTAGDADGDGNLTLDELHALLKSQGYAPTRQTTLEAMEELDSDGNEGVSFREFEGLRDYLRWTEGFCKAEVKQFDAIYKRTFGKAQQNKTPSKAAQFVATECHRISQYVGYAVSKEKVHRIAEQVDKDGSGRLNFTELLKIMRRIRDEEYKDLGEFMKSRGNAEKLAVQDLALAFIELGYFASDEVIAELVGELGLPADHHYLTFEDIGAFLQSYRRAEGFTEAEVTELRQVFDREVETPPAMDALEVGRCLRWFGFSKTVHQVQQLVEEIDFDGSHNADFSDFVKIMRLFNRGEAEKRQKVFNDLDVNKMSQLHKKRFGVAIEDLQGAPPDPKLLEEALRTFEEGDGGGDSAASRSAFVDAKGWRAFCKRYRALVMSKVQENGGYTPAEVSHLRRVFDTFDADKSGTIERQELLKLVEEHFPEAYRSTDSRAAMQKVLDEVDSGNMQLEFREFLWLMRKCDDKRDARDIRMEQEVVKECSLTPEEVDGYRQIFSDNVDWKGEMSLSSFTSLLGGIREMDAGQIEALGEMVREVNPDGREVVRFPQFLRLIKRITQHNVLGVNDAASEVNRREEKLEKIRRKTRGGS